ncbi:hypothetical protein PHLCEN_2v1095 [Hermanssonia centrifuga]|uniref:B30.2/SPRY domain-containing protein n=1 Tax=Hermanssonia centrifuga TaxID=98765 RepID=A0A2R6S454_9APHY|nr:hypothetical protein PHLCEN_2v1095 [Hermanssonia centrifuga]
MGKMAESSIRLPSPLGLPFVYPETRAVLMRCPEWEVVSGDVVGCGVDFDDQIIFFIKNGMPMGEYRLFVVVSLHRLNIQAGVTTFAYFGIARVVTLVPAVELEPPSATVFVNFGHSPFRWNPPGKSEDTNLIPRALFNAYESFFVAASSWDIVHEQVDVSPDGRQLWKSMFNILSVIGSRVHYYLTNTRTCLSPRAD